MSKIKEYAFDVRNAAEYLVDTYRGVLMNEDTECGNEVLCTSLAVKCSIIAVKRIMLSNPHSNPFMDKVHSTFDYWNEVLNFIETNEW